jgi:thiamine-monophosphate kinase
MNQTVGQLGEQGVLKLVQQFCPADIVGDDAAVLATNPGASIVVTTDVLVDKVHFSDRTTPPHSAGWRAIAANLSDLAAMGATPLGITVGLGLPPETSVSWVEALYQGMSDCLQQFGGAIVGGDVVRSPVRTIAITAWGQVNPEQVIRRSGAQVNDVIIATGVHGAARAGLACLLSEGSTFSAAEQVALIRAHQYPQPRLNVAYQCHQLGRVAGMDSSDGLADAVLQICRSSNVGAEITYMPMPPALQKHPQGKDWTLYGGEDFELVLCITPSDAQTLLQQFTDIRIVGHITSALHVWLRDSRFEPELLRLDRGFQHFAPPG